jgi:undecaprenyl-diphosphatase
MKMTKMNNFWHVKKPLFFERQQKIIFLIVLVILLSFILCLIFDNQILSFFLILRTKTGISLDFVENDYIIFPIIIIVQLLFILIDSKGFKTGKRKFIYLIIALVLTFLISTLLKTIISRERPLTSPHKLFPDFFLDKYSFPSGHTSTTFTLFAFIKSKVLIWIWVIFAIFIMVSRLWNGMHYPSDVIAGAVLGYLVPVIMLKITKGAK